MIRLFLLPVIWILAFEVGQAREQQFPYVAYVAESEAYVRSGPGQKYYPTQQLPEGLAVEVYRHDANGWCAVRPPEGSFSWISAHQVRIVNQTVAEVSAEGVVTRIGSSLSPARSAVQVLLPRGERVELLAGLPNDNPDWLRVAAPAGEFRWIAAKHLSLQPPMESAPPVSVSTKQASAGWSNHSPHLATQGAIAEQPIAAFQHLQDSNAGFQNSNAFQPPAASIGNTSFGTLGSTVSTNHNPNTIDVVAGSPAEMQLAQFQQQAERLVSPALLGQQPPLESSTPNTLSTQQVGAPESNGSFRSPPRVRFRGLSESDRSVAQRLEELQLRLSQTVVQPPEQWRFEQLQSEANGLLENAESPRIRSQLRDLLDRIVRFQRVRAGYEGGAMPLSGSLVKTEQTSQLEEGLTGLTSKVRDLAKADLVASEIATNTDSPAGEAVDKPLYDAVGLLKPVTSKRAKAPQYALVDDKGEVVSFITPTPDLNLKPYLGRRIGVHGKRGFMQEYRRAHVTAERISPIADRIRR